MTANYLVCNIEDTNKRAEYKRKTRFSFYSRAKVSSAASPIDENKVEPRWLHLVYIHARERIIPYPGESSSSR